MGVGESKRSNPRVRLLLLVLLWIWALCVFVVVDLFLSVEEFSAVRPRSSLYGGMRVAAHKMVGESLEEAEILPAGRGYAVPGDSVLTRAGATAIEGVIYSADGTPLAGARVAARDARTDGVVTTMAGEGGVFRLEAVVGRAYDLAAGADDHGSAMRLGVLAPCRVALVLTGNSRILGRAMDKSGRGVSGVVLRLLVRTGPHRGGGGKGLLDHVFPVNATTGPDGNYVLTPVPPSDRVGIGLMVAGGPVRVGKRAPVHVPVSADVRCDVQVERAAPVEVTGNVRDAVTGDAIDGAEIEFSSGGATRSDRSGSFRMEGVPLGNVTLAVRVKGRPRFFQQTFVSEAPAALDLRVPAGRVVTGVVLGPDDRPVARSSVRWIGSTAGQGSQSTGQDGRFRLDGIARDDRGVVRVASPGMVTAEARPRPDQPELVMHLERGSRVEGRVVLPEGVLHDAGILVQIMPCVELPLTKEGRATAPTGIDVQRIYATRADADGCYVLDSLPAGVKLLVVVSDDPTIAPLRKQIVVPVAQAIAIPTLRLQRGRTVEGQVVDPEDRPIAGAVVQLLSDVRPAVTVSDESGRFCLDGLSSCEMNITVTCRDYLRSQTTIRPESSEQLRVRLAPRQMMPAPPGK